MVIEWGQVFLLFDPKDEVRHQRLTRRQRKLPNVQKGFGIGISLQASIELLALVIVGSKTPAGEPFPEWYLMFFGVCVAGLVLNALAIAALGLWRLGVRLQKKQLRKRASPCELRNPELVACRAMLDEICEPALAECISDPDRFALLVIRHAGYMQLVADQAGANMHGQSFVETLREASSKAVEINVNAERRQLAG